VHPIASPTPRRSGEGNYLASTGLARGRSGPERPGPQGRMVRNGIRIASSMNRPVEFYD